MSYPTIKFPVKASLGKRKVQDLGRDLTDAEMSVTVGGYTDNPELNIWISDSDERRFGLRIRKDQIKVLKDLLNLIPCLEEG